MADAFILGEDFIGQDSVCLILGDNIFSGIDFTETKKIIKTLKVQDIRATKWGVSDSIAVKTFNELYSKKIRISRN